MSLPTEFAPAERMGAEEIEEQHRAVAGLPFVADFLDAIPNMAMVLNECRQIVFANKVFCDFVGAETVRELIGNRQGEVLRCIHAEYIGKRPGEAVGCIRADLTQGGCGTTLFCRTCGAVRSILSSQELNTLDVQECRMICGEEQQPLDLRVWARPLQINGHRLTVFSVMNISDEKRRKALERIFFHDVLNTAGGVKGLADLLRDSGLPETEIRDVAGMISESADQLIEEISAQRMLTAAESGDLKVHVQPVETLEILCRVIRQFHSFSWATDKKLLVDEAAEHVNLETDPVLLRRVLINLTKNALEASEAGETVTLSSFEKNGQVGFTVHNRKGMPADVQLQVFSRSFSTKGSGRGLGTYSIRLITERYLQGDVWFVSDEKQGTLFTAVYPKQIAPQPDSQEHAEERSA